jgi:hypothetical protein
VRYPRTLKLAASQQTRVPIRSVCLLLLRSSTQTRRYHHVARDDLCRRGYFCIVGSHVSLCRLNDRSDGDAASAASLGGTARCWGSQQPYVHRAVRRQNPGRPRLPPKVEHQASYQRRFPGRTLETAAALTRSGPCCARWRRCQRRVARRALCGARRARPGAAGCGGARRCGAGASPGAGGGGYGG